MARPRDPHPLGKCAEERLDIAMPAELKLRLNAVAALQRKHPTTWARDDLEKSIEGNWALRNGVAIPRRDLWLATVSSLRGMDPESWQRLELDKRIVGEWVFMRRRVGGAGPDDNGITT